MVEIGYNLTSELHSANEMVLHARQAEAAGFTFAMISDHFHPFFNQHGESPFVWSVIGAIAHTTQRLRLGTAVTCPLIRYHPAIIAQAAATCETMMPGRFMLGVGTGANVNEHIVGQGWPSPAVRVEMLAEAIEIIRLLWQGRQQNYHGKYYDLDQARLYSIPETPPPLLVAAGGKQMARLAARLGDGMVALSADKTLIDTYRSSNGVAADCPRYGEMTVCWAKSEAEARHTAFEWWPLGLIPGQIIPELPVPAQYDTLSALFTENDISKAIVCGPDPQAHLARIQEFIDAGFTHIYIHQVGSDQESFFKLYREEILPKFQ